MPLKLVRMRLGRRAENIARSPAAGRS